MESIFEPGLKLVCQLHMGHTKIIPGFKPSGDWHMEFQRFNLMAIWDSHRPTLDSYNLPITSAKMVLKQTIDVWNAYHEVTGVFEDLARAKERAISRTVELLSLLIEHKDARRIRKRITKHNRELFTFWMSLGSSRPIIGLSGN